MEVYQSHHGSAAIQIKQFTNRYGDRVYGMRWTEDFITYWTLVSINGTTIYYQEKMSKIVEDDLPWGDIEPFSQLKWLNCAECGEVSWLDYLCPACRA